MKNSKSALLVAMTFLSLLTQEYVALGRITKVTVGTNGPETFTYY